MGALNKLKRTFLGSGFDESERPNEGDYIEIEPGEAPSSRAKILVKPYIIRNFEDIKPVLDDVREGATIALVNIRPIKDKDLVELKRTVSKLKKTTDAIEGDIAGFGEDWIVVTPSFAQVHRRRVEDKRQETKSL